MERSNIRRVVDRIPSDLRSYLVWIMVFGLPRTLVCQESPRTMARWLRACPPTRPGGDDDVSQTVVCGVILQTFGDQDDFWKDVFAAWMHRQADHPWHALYALEKNTAWVPGSELGDDQVARCVDFMLSTPLCLSRREDAALALDLVRWGVVRPPFVFSSFVRMWEAQLNASSRGNPLFLQRWSVRRD